MSTRKAAEGPAESLAVYEVVRNGLDEAQARKLAEAFGIPADQVIVRDGVVTFIDQTGYLRVPTMEVTDPDIVERLRAMNGTGRPETRLRLESIDFEALENLPVMDHDTAVRKAAEAFAAAGLRFESVRPIPAHTTFTASFVDGSRPRNKITRELQTKVSYEFSDGKGHPFIGPGAQAQVNYNGSGQVVHLHYSRREMKEGPAVRIFSEEEARRRVAHKFPHQARINLWLVYWCPSLRRGPGRKQPLSPKFIIPWYAYNSVIRVTDPQTGAISERRTKIRLMPATDDRRFVPSVNLKLSGRERVEAVAEVTGGREPYSYIWSGSNPEASEQGGNSVSYTPISRGIAPIRLTPPRQVERIETVGVTVTDANGVMILHNATIGVASQLITHGKGGGPSASYGTESPREPDFAVDRVGWQNGMATVGAGGGTQVFAWLGDLAWPGDFIEPNPQGTLMPSPWINGDADYANWGVNTAAIVLNNTDGWAQGFNSSEPGATIAEYTTAEVLCPSNPGYTVVTNLLNGNPTATTQYSNVNYNGAWTPIGPNDQLLWLVMDCCDCLDATSSSGSPQDRWGAAFGGLHILFGFNSEEQVGDGSFEQDFAEYMLGIPTSMTILQAWFAAGAAAGVGGPPQHGIPAALGPITTGDVCDSGDFYLGKGTQGPNIIPGAITGWWYLSD